MTIANTHFLILGAETRVSTAAACVSLLSMSQDLHPGDFLVYQLESAVALLRVLDIDEIDGQRVWHLAAYDDFFPEVEAAENAIASPESLSVSRPHVALTDRGFESTQVARIAHAPLTDHETLPLIEWKKDDGREIHDRSIRLLLGLR